MAAATAAATEQQQAPLSDFLCPLLAVRVTSNEVMEHAIHVRIDDAAVEREAENIKDAGAVVWNHESVHYDGSNQDAVVQGLLVLDTLNFCFWPDAEWEYDRLAGALKCLLNADDEALSASRLRKLTVPTLRTWLGGDLPNMEERVRLLREVGEELERSFGGKASNLVRAANKSASMLVHLVIKHFAGFRDATIYRGKQVFLYKRAQIFVGDVWGAFNHEGLGEFTDIEKITTFPDYRVPQLLRELGVMEYSADLAGRIDHLIEIEPGSREEVEIRAATVVSVERLKAALAAKGVARTSVELDWDLWQRGEAVRKTIKPHHRTLTIFY